tara:strand:- start:517 stop:648 length:132 start_codon:yes stop_codon:yes gene_type:complete
VDQTNKKAAAASAGRPRALAAFILRPQAELQIGASQKYQNFLN